MIQSSFIVNDNPHLCCLLYSRRHPVRRRRGTDSHAGAAMSLHPTFDFFDHILIFCLDLSNLFDFFQIFGQTPTPTPTPTPVPVDPLGLTALEKAAFDACEPSSWDLLLAGNHDDRSAGPPYFMGCADVKNDAGDQLCTA